MAQLQEVADEQPLTPGFVRLHSVVLQLVHARSLVLLHANFGYWNDGHDVVQLAQVPLVETGGFVHDELTNVPLAQVGFLQAAAQTALPPPMTVLLHACAGYNEPVQAVQVVHVLLPGNTVHKGMVVTSLQEPARYAFAVQEQPAPGKDSGIGAPQTPT